MLSLTRAMRMFINVASELVTICEIEEEINRFASIGI